MVVSYSPSSELAVAPAGRETMRPEISTDMNGLKIPEGRAISAFHE